jgi:hypothetical protein
LRVKAGQRSAERHAVGEYLAEFVEERIAKYRLLAQEARNAALNSRNQEAIDMHMAMATAWEHLALELEHLEDMQPNHELIAQKRDSDSDPLSRTVLRREK